MLRRNRATWAMLAAVLPFVLGAVIDADKKEPPPQQQQKPSEPEMVLIKGGMFMMGSPASESGREDREGPVHEVTVSDFYMGKYEVTFAQYDTFCEAKERKKQLPGDQAWGRGNRPVIGVSWNNARGYCEWLSRETGKEYRLPTEAEWEYACRAGTSTPFSFGLTISTDQANYNGNHVYGDGRKGVYRKETVEVGSFAPNAWGLYDMHGNVQEWCTDWHGVYNSKPQIDPQGPSSGSARVLRGGSWYNYPGSLRSAYRFMHNPGKKIYYLGFRVCRSVSAD